MKKSLAAGIIIATAIVVAPISVFAYEVSVPWTKNIYKVSELEDAASTISTFDDRGNKCYVVNSNGYYNSGANSISCVKQGK